MAAAMATLGEIRIMHYKCVIAAQAFFIRHAKSRRVLIVEKYIFASPAAQEDSHSDCDSSSSVLNDIESIASSSLQWKQPTKPGLAKTGGEESAGKSQLSTGRSPVAFYFNNVSSGPVKSEL
ncbi:hypothetical protein DY000_02033552 [Brassica cretica]|uniref:DUF4005 domain-containing protein n=1 Tax=Brassica cretica TaxID=69181 RepID=A0ABQ7DQZ7_BRACR|nr:hypothetical protein DY000_02033552 [Brassica cretica]